MLAVFTFLYVVTRALSISPTVEVIPPGTPEIVIVTVLDHDMPKGYVERIKENREDYAKRHGKSKAATRQDI
jgi:mannan polymerase II complex MNN11 subunit